MFYFIKYKKYKKRYFIFINKIIYKKNRKIYLKNI